MAIEKNITMKQFNGTDYDTLYPKTIASQIPDVYSKTEVLTLIDGGVKFQTGSYVGTGTSGPDNPCSLTFDFVPKYVQICPFVGSGKLSNFIGLFYYSPQKMFAGHTVDGRIDNWYAQNLPVSVDGNTITWYQDGNHSANFQLNYNGVSYYYVAIG